VFHPADPGITNDLVAERRQRPQVAVGMAVSAFMVKIEMWDQRP
jgi:hypothetical protein